MRVKGEREKTKDETHCQRCHGRMAFEKFYGQDSSFFGWHCVMCGDVLDPVILLHRLSHDANVSIPESEKEMMGLIKKYMRSPRPKNISIKIPSGRIQSPYKFF
jgi:hypothetical protein